MHENQLTYPLPEDGTTGPMRRQLGERDRHYAFINYASMLAADQILFNSRYHHDCFFAALPNFLKHFPEYNELNSATELYEKSEVVPVGVNLRRLDQTAERRIPETSGKPPLILWNQRWEYDKNPEGFFAALMILADRGIPFRVALCGQQYGKQPAVFADAGKRLGDQVVHEGFANADLYAKLLWEADITISTAWHEFFGISIIEAIYARTFPLLPTRLSYPEIIPKSFHAHCLYDDQEGLVKRLQWALTHTKEARVQAKGLATAVSRYDWLKIAPRYDQMMYTIVNS